MIASTAWWLPEFLVNTQKIYSILCAMIQGSLFDMKMYLHLFTTAGVCLTASVINSDLAELFCWSSSRVWSVPGLSWYSEHPRLLYIHSQTRHITQPHSTSGESYYSSGWNLLKVLNALWGWKSRIRDGKVKRRGEGVREGVNKHVKLSHSLQSLIEKLQ